MQITLFNDLELFTLIVFSVFIIASLIQLVYYWAVFARLAFYKIPQNLSVGKPPVSVVIAARNEAGNITNIFKRIPEMGAGTELIC